MAVPQPVAVQLYPNDHPALRGRLQARLAARKAELLNELMLASDWGDYCLRKGHLEEIDNAIRHCAEVEEELTKR